MKVENLLRGAIRGVETNRVTLDAAESGRLAAPSGAARVLIFVEGRGEARTGGRAFPWDGIAVLVSGPGAECALRTDAPARAISVECRIASSESASAELPWFRSYADCPAYREAIKSPNTVSRTIVPEGVVPRFCMGSVEVRGPDAVAAHRHPKLEQLFYGLPGNDCIVRADGADIPLGGDLLIHIPTGSEHAVRVASGKLLHYLWLDFFRREEDMDVIRQTHIPIAPGDGGTR